MAAKSSSCGVCVSFQPERDAAQLGIHQHRAIAVVPWEAQQAGFARAKVFDSLGELGYGGSRASGDGFEYVAGGGKSGFDARHRRMHRAMHHSTDAGNQVSFLRNGDDAGGGSDHVDDVAGPDARRDRVPMRVECADGDRDACAQP